MGVARLRGVVPPPLLRHADPAHAVSGAGREPGKHRAARGGRQDADDARARRPQQVGEVLRAQQGRVVSGEKDEDILLAE